MINTRRTVNEQKLTSEAAYRFERGVHPALASEGVQLGLERMAAWSGGQIAADLVDAYPQPHVDPTVKITRADVLRHLGIALSLEEIAEILTRLEFTCHIEGDTVAAQSPPLRLDIGEGVIGLADVMEEIARIYGFDNIPAKQLADSLPYQRSNPALMKEEHLQGTLVSLGLQEVVTYRMTTPERENRIFPADATQPQPDYLRLENPISQERTVMRRSLLASVLEVMLHNFRLQDSLAFFEIGNIFLPQPGQRLPREALFLVLAMSGKTDHPAWDREPGSVMDFYDIKGILEIMLESMHIPQAETAYDIGKHPSFHPGKCAELKIGGEAVGVFGELHPLVNENYGFGSAPVLAAEIDLSVLLESVPLLYDVAPVPIYPSILEDIAIILDDAIPSGRVEQIIRKAGGDVLADVRLFDIYRGEKIGAGKKSLAYSLSYQAADRTLTDKEAAKIRHRIVKRLEKEVGAVLRSE